MICECGREFDTIKKLRRHRSRCIKTTKEEWLKENHYCETCGKLLTEIFGSGRFCNNNCCARYKHNTKAKVKKIRKNPGKANTLEKEELRRKKISETMKNKNLGGYRPGSGKGKQGWYKSYWCDSSWELAFVIYNLEHKIKFERNKQKFDYTYKGKTHKYLPDFILNNQYIEIKGYERDNDAYKYKVCSNLKVLYKKDMKIYLDYVKEKYGKHFTYLYEK